MHGMTEVTCIHCTSYNWYMCLLSVRVPASSCHYNCSLFDHYPPLPPISPISLTGQAVTARPLWSIILGKIGASKQKELCGKNRLTFLGKIGAVLQEPNCNCSNACKLVLLMQPSSATAELIFLIYHPPSLQHRNHHWKIVYNYHSCCSTTIEL